MAEKEATRKEQSKPLTVPQHARQDPMRERYGCSMCTGKCTNRDRGLNEAVGKEEQTHPVSRSPCCNLGTLWLQLAQGRRKPFGDERRSGSCPDPIYTHLPYTSRVPCTRCSYYVRGLQAGERSAWGACSAFPI